MKKNDKLIEYYFQILKEVRKFAKNYSLDYEFESALSGFKENYFDPHVEILIKSFCYISAKIKKNSLEYKNDFHAQIASVFLKNIKLPKPSTMLIVFNVKNSTKFQPTFVENNSKLSFQLKEHLYHFELANSLYLFPFIINQITKIQAIQEYLFLGEFNENYLKIDININNKITDFKDIYLPFLITNDNLFNSIILQIFKKNKCFFSNINSSFIQGETVKIFCLSKFLLEKQPIPISKIELIEQFNFSRETFSSFAIKIPKEILNSNFSIFIPIEKTFNKEIDLNNNIFINWSLCVNSFKLQSAPIQFENDLVLNLNPQNSDLEIIGIHDIFGFIKGKKTILKNYLLDFVDQDENYHKHLSWFNSGIENFNFIQICFNKKYSNEEKKSILDGFDFFVADLICMNIDKIKYNISDYEIYVNSENDINNFIQGFKIIKKPSLSFKKEEIDFNLALKFLYHSFYHDINSKNIKNETINFIKFISNLSLLHIEEIETNIINDIKITKDYSTNFNIPNIITLVVKIYINSLCNLDFLIFLGRLFILDKPLNFYIKVEFILKENSKKFFEMCYEDLCFDD